MQFQFLDNDVSIRKTEKKNVRKKISPKTNISVRKDKFLMVKRLENAISERK